MWFSVSSVWVDICLDHWLHKLFHEEFLLEEEFVVVLELKIDFFLWRVHCFARAFHRVLRVVESISRHDSRQTSFRIILFLGKFVRHAYDGTSSNWLVRVNQLRVSFRRAADALQPRILLVAFQSFLNHYIMQCYRTAASLVELPSIFFLFLFQPRKIYSPNIPSWHSHLIRVVVVECLTVSVTAKVLQILLFVWKFDNLL